jgi:hypothetical protein
MPDVAVNMQLCGMFAILCVHMTFRRFIADDWTRKRNERDGGKALHQIAYAVK